MRYASTFLSHSSSDKPLVEAVANELGRRGIISWLDKSDLTAGQDINAALKEAIRRQATVCVFLSGESVKSEWVRDELAVALEKAKESDRIIPIYLGAPLNLVESHPLLKSRWLHPDGDRVKHLGICPSLGTAVSEQARTIADEVARGIYADLKISIRSEIILYLDQRGNGDRHGEPDGIPENVAALDAHALVFRPMLGRRHQDEVLYGAAWKDVWSDIESSLASAIGTIRGPDIKKIRILGNAQLGLPFFLGCHFNRNTSAHLYCYNMDGSVFSNREQARCAPLKGGDANCETAHPEITAVPPDDEQEAISLLLVTENYVPPVIDYLHANSATYPKYSYLVEHDRFTSSEQVMSYIADIVALLLRLKREHRVCTIYLFCALPFHVLPLLGANLLHVMDTVVFMEYRRDLQGRGADAGEMYTPLKDWR